MNALTTLPVYPRPAAALTWMGLALLVGLAAYVSLPVARGAALMLLCLLPLVGLYAVSPRQVMAVSMLISVALLLCACGLWRLDAMNFRWDDDGLSAMIACGMTLAVGSITRELNHSQLRQCEHHQALVNTLNNLQQQATKDMQTGLPNQAYMREWMRQAAKRAQRSGQPLSLALLARDQAKELPQYASADTPAQAPDELAFDQWVACANLVFRENDVTARWSNEELLVLFEGSSPEQAREGLTRLRNETGCVAFSSGLLTWQASESIDDAIARAHGALQRARQAGGQRDELV
jgi:GGDEF domain-containing protein